MKLVTLVLTIIMSTALQADQVIHAGFLVDTESGSVLPERSIVINNGRVVKVVKGYIAGEQVIDLKDSTVMPGLMDMHTHLTSGASPSAYTEKFFHEQSFFAIRAVVNAEKTLMAGFTTVRDLGSDPRVTREIDQAIDNRTIKGPRIFNAGKSIATTGGHADPTNGVNQELMGSPGPTEGVINGPDDAYEAVRQRYKEGSEVIKLTVTGGVLSLAKSGDNPQFTDRELDAIMAAAKDYNFTVAVHAHGVEGMKRAIKAGVHSVEHGTYMDAEAMRMMRKQGTYYVPTITAGKWVAEKADTYPKIVQPKAKAVGPQIQTTFGKAYKAGVKIAFGTDAGVFPHGLNGREFQYMVEAGMPAIETIQAATINAAKLLRVDHELGSISAGKIADIVAVKGEPLKDMRLMQSVHFVMKDGIIYKQP
ncbi:metal-dependent hydrolase family protein [Pleionea litopenaei]|uniref:Amidohydrolase family protein n=1 Tax=Pleionea litopenaei TaxID=3070815 RepID=A0AA51RSS0_9GAMM|nr:amidohydrolase family protein [Pleionea sp. HL-JVS1]WMS86897.1 amidohydrolase family protein [Pleionea sp. HL-JVS1]